MDDSAPRLRTDLLVMAQIRRCASEGKVATLIHRGDPGGGAILLKLNMLAAGCRVLSQARDGEGRAGWLVALGGKTVPEAEADAYIHRAIDRDPDLWVLEIEDREGLNPFEGREIG